jgi:hypothetical protein
MIHTQRVHKRQKKKKFNSIIAGVQSEHLFVRDTNQSKSVKTFLFLQKICFLFFRFPIPETRNPKMGNNRSSLLLTDENIKEISDDTGCKSVNFYLDEG